MLAMLERVDRYTRCGLDSARHLDDDIDRVAGGEHRRVVGQHRQPLADCRFRLTRSPYTAPLPYTRFPECPLSVCRRPIRDRHEANPRRWRTKLQGDGPARRTGADHADADGIALGLTVPKCRIDDHGLTSYRS
jgi:hypothetical protein